jgi:hypothetical protein
MEQALLLKASCVRCGAPCTPGENKNPKAQPFRKAQTGLCANCAVTQFLLSIETLKDGLLKNGLGLLKKPEVQRQFAALLEVGHSELPINEINWNTVIDQWGLPFPKGYKPS